MNKKRKIWLTTLILFLLIDIFLHFTIHTDGSLIGIHLNYIASVLMAFTTGAEVSDLLWR